jgi:hypothetical protein
MRRSKACCYDWSIEPTRKRSKEWKRIEESESLRYSDYLLQEDEGSSALAFLPRLLM